MIRYRKIGYIALNVTDLARSRRFYQDIVGLQPNGEGPDGSALFRLDAAHHSIMLYPAAQAGVKRFAFQLENDAQFDVLARALDTHGIALREVDRAECDALGQGRSVRFTDPYSGATWECYASMREEATPFVPSVVPFDRLGHIVLRTDRFDEAIDFYCGTLNFRLSDKVVGQIAFMRCFPNKYHHMLAVAKSARPGLHHVNLMVPSIDDWGRCVARLARQNIDVVWGPGRHTNAGTFFVYYLDPDGLTLEYGFSMEEFPEVGAREARVRPPGHESVDLWDSRIDPRTCAAGEIETLASS
ncbi:MAG TPA: VOC family protein [Burkholderiales bacterium]|nr:VOC family protein [Burkholderiales bacterium]